MDHFGSDDYQALLAAQQGPAVSIYFPAQRLDNKGKNNQLAFRAHVKRARALLAERYADEPACEAICAMMDARLEDGEFWGTLTRGAAAFFAPGFERIYRLNQDVLAETVVGDTFHTRPMLRMLGHPPRYWVLALDSKDTRLYEVRGRDVRQVGMGVIPTDVESALFQPYPPQQQDRQREVNRAGTSLDLHGVGPGRDARPDLLRQYVQIVDARLQEWFGDKRGPLILGAAGQINALFRQECTLDNLFAHGLDESISRLSTAEIRARAQPVIEQYAAHNIDAILGLWEREYGHGQGELDLQQIARRTLMSQVRYLFIERGRRIWGKLNRDDGTIHIESDSADSPENAQDGQPDILDDLAEFVISRGGEAFVLSPEKMPSETGAAAILRGTGPFNVEEQPRPRI